MEQLQRQRALMQEHLRWLECEIAAEASSVPPPGPTPPAVPASATEPSDPSPEHASAASAHETPPLPNVPEADVRGIHSEVRSGCLLYLGIALVGLAAMVGLVYWLY